MTRFHRGSDGWGRDSYRIPRYAVAGSSDTGTWYDSPAPSNKVIEELDRLRAHLRENGIPSRYSGTRSGNLFMVKRWVIVSGKDYPKAQKLADEWLKAHESDTQHIHDAY